MSGASFQSVHHATSVAWQGKGLLIRGPSGSGKSSLALDLIGRGAVLVSDDRTCLTATPQGLILSAPDTIRGLIEARGMGILNAETVPQVPLHLIIDLSKHQTERLPEQRSCDMLGFNIPIIYSTGRPDFPVALAHFLSFGRKA